jgi:hypothetical protein
LPDAGRFFVGESLVSHWEDTGELLGSHPKMLLPQFIRRDPQPGDLLVPTSAIPELGNLAMLEFTPSRR